MTLPATHMAFAKFLDCSTTSRCRGKRTRVWIRRGSRPSDGDQGADTETEWRGVGEVRKGGGTRRRNQKGGNVRRGCMQKKMLRAWKNISIFKLLIAGAVCFTLTLLDTEALHQERSIERLDSRTRRLTRRQLSMRESSRSPNSSKSCALGSGPSPCGRLRGRMGFCVASGPRCSLNDFLRLSQREEGACAALVARSVRGTSARERGARLSSSSSSCLMRSSSELIPCSLSVVGGVGSLEVFSESHTDGAEPSESDCESDGQPIEGAQSRGPWTNASSREARDRWTQPRRCWWRHMV